ncbi:MAG: hypothetical protein HFH91_08615 [Lachnospiraceae bacterium]|nr:hypothetical protein [Lachnospiraceae bacterium]
MPFLQWLAGGNKLLLIESTENALEGFSHTIGKSWWSCRMAVICDCRGWRDLV